MKSLNDISLNQQQIDAINEARTSFKKNVGKAHDEVIDTKPAQ